jgi:hypothetical protein
VVAEEDDQLAVGRQHGLGVVIGVVCDVVRQPATDVLDLLLTGIQGQ